MKVISIFRPAVLVAILALAAPAMAQSVSTADIQRLQDQVYDASNEVSRLRSRDPQLAERLQDQLDDVRDEVVYLRVKLRKEGNVTRSDYNDVRTRVDRIRADARGESTRQGTGFGTGSTGSSGSSGYGSSSTGGYGAGSGGNTGYGDTRQTTPARRNEVPAGQELDVRIERELSSETAQVEDRFTATTMVDLYQGNDVLIPAGSTMRGVVSSVTKATRTDRKGSLTVAFDQVTIRGRNYPIRATVTQALESEGIKGEAAKIGAGAGVGAIIGGILGGAKGALLGVLIGGGGTIAATEGTNVKLPAGTVLRVRFDQALQVR